MNRGWKALAICCALCATAAEAEVFTRDGSAGQTGTPYGYLGPRGRKSWENYRKLTNLWPPYLPEVEAANASHPEQVTYRKARFSCPPAQPDCNFAQPG